MSCLYCGSRLISKTPAGLECCGCGRPLLQTRPHRSLALTPGRPWLVLLACCMALPLAGALTTADRLRSGLASPAAQEAGASASAGE